MTVRKLVLTGIPDEDRGRLEEFCQLLTATEQAAGLSLRALAVELAGLGGLEVSAVAYGDESLELEVVLAGDESLELEVVLAGDESLEPVSIGRDKTGGYCQVSWERWADIGDDAVLEKTARMIAAVAASCAASR